MIQAADLAGILGDAFFGGNSTIAGIAIYAVVLAIVMGITRKVFTGLVVALPVTLIFSPMGLGIISADFMLLMIIVCVLGIVLTIKDISVRS